MRLLMVVISVIVVVIIWWRNGKVAPGDWFGATLMAAIMVLVVLVAAAVIAIFEWLASARATAATQVVVITVLMIISSLLLIPVYLVASLISGYAEPVRNFLATLQQLPDPTDYGVVKPLLTGLNVAHVGLLVGIGVAAVAVIASIVLLILWVVTPRSMGWLHRRVAQVALWIPPLLLILCGALIAFTRWKTLDIQKKIAEGLPSTLILDDWLIWILLVGTLVTIVTFMAGVGRAGLAAILAQRVPQGNALRVDPLGMVVDDVKYGPQRLTWPVIDIICGRPHQPLPGPELVIGRSGQGLWTVPFLYLDVMPGTIDSAVRAHTQDNRDLDMTPLDKVF